LELPCVRIRKRKTGKTFQKHMDSILMEYFPRKEKKSFGGCVEKSVIGFPGELLFL
jgi:hypothetical protein